MWVKPIKYVIFAAFPHFAVIFPKSSHYSKFGKDWRKVKKSPGDAQILHDAVAKQENNLLNSIKPETSNSWGSSQWQKRYITLKYELGCILQKGKSGNLHVATIVLWHIHSVNNSLLDLLCVSFSYCFPHSASYKVSSLFPICLEL